MRALRERILDFLVEYTHSRYTGDRDKAYTDSYRALRRAVGILGILLPFIFLIGDSVIGGSVRVRGSISEYYHTPMQDIFVGGLCIIGFLLILYMAGEYKSLDFLASVIAGVAVLGVVFFPTSRSGLPAGAPACGSVPQTPPGCSFTEQAFGEGTTATIHAVFAIVFIVFLAVMSFLFAISEVGIDSEVKSGQRTVANRPNPHVFGKPISVSGIHVICGLVILTAGAWVWVGGALGADIWELTPLYVGEVASVLAFGLSWLLAGWSPTAPSRLGPAGETQELSAALGAPPST